MTDGVMVAAAASSSSTAVLADIVVVLAAYVIFGLAARLLRQSVLVGYLLAGVVIGGPTSLGLVQDVNSFSFMGEIGVALLLFTVGLDLPIRKVRRFGATALVAGGLQCFVTTGLVMAIAMAAGLGGAAAFVVGIAVSLSSTAVVLSLLSERSESDSIHGLVTTGMLIAQDVLVVLVLLAIPLLPGASSSTEHSGFLIEFATAVAKLAGVLALIVLVERVIMRRAFQNRQLVQTRELLALSSITVSLGAIALCWSLGLSPALGGFMAGVVMADAPYAPHVRSEIAPIRMGLIAIFFAYVGMLADAGWMLEHAWLIIAIVVPLIVGKACIAWAAARVARVPAPAAIMTAIALAQVGEFSFAALTAGVAVDVVDADTFRLMVSVSLVTLLATPLLIEWTGRLLHARLLHSGADVQLRADGAEHAIADHAIVIGAGPAGRTVVAALAGVDVPVTVIELNPHADTGADGDDDLHSDTRIVFGDAARPEILARANLDSARIVVVTVPDPLGIRTVVAQCAQLAPHVPVIARGRYHRYVPDIAEVGATRVVDEELITGRELASVALDCIDQRPAVD